ncbi:AbrB/MazE/SpoVT family DNA-binding domain-containing protein [Halosolutus amylolyticus]|uniref:AbrB/MazE/SpoVT family DNA-binding domain-containing protein n=1 Tax=Halosolutus amylolyticus TaxID=2932267 RepID=A0ABD5PRV6_9EURY|nr:AbrB/MazE/SpoVT family DNA-binding domain-containing protein [Halosolutus amylolyticus]
MSSTDDTATEEEYGEAEINDRGRLTIPKELRDDLHIEGGTTFTVVREGRDIRLVRHLPELQTLSTGKSRDDWGEKAFRDAGEATFGGR